MATIGYFRLDYDCTINFPPRRHTIDILVDKLADLNTTFIVERLSLCDGLTTGFSFGNFRLASVVYDIWRM